MPNDIPKMEAAGWKSFDFTLVRDPQEQPLMVSDEIIRDYMRYVSTCKQAQLACLSFADWLSPTPRPIEYSVETRATP